MDEALLGTTTPSQFWPGSNGNEGVLLILSISIRCSLVSNPGRTFLLLQEVPLFKRYVFKILS